MGAKVAPRRPDVGQPFVYSFSSPYRVFALAVVSVLYLYRVLGADKLLSTLFVCCFTPFHVEFRTVSFKLLVNRQSHGRRRIRIGSKSTWQRSCEECDGPGQKTTLRSSRRTRAQRHRSSRLRKRPNAVRSRCGRRHGNSE